MCKNHVKKQFRYFYQNFIKKVVLLECIEIADYVMLYDQSYLTNMRDLVVVNNIC